MGFYLAPDETSTIDSVVATLKERPVKLLEPEGKQRGEYIVVALATEGLKDMLAHFLLHQRSW